MGKLLKFLGIFMIILAILMFLIGLLIGAYISFTVIALISAGIGALTIRQGKRLQHSKSEPSEPKIEPQPLKQSASQRPQADSDPIIMNSYAPPAEKSCTVERFVVAGTDYFQHNLKDIAEPSHDWNMTVKEADEAFITDEKIYRYEMDDFEVSFRREKDNPHDPNAIAVYADDVQVGYIARADQRRFATCGKSKILSAVVSVYGGDYKTLEPKDDWNSDKFVWVKHEDTLRAVVVLKLEK